MGMDKFEADPKLFLDAAKEAPTEGQIRWQFVNKTLGLVKEGMDGSRTVGADIEYAIADFADTYPGFNVVRAAEFASRVLLRSTEAVRLVEDQTFKEDLTQLIRDYTGE